MTRPHTPCGPGVYYGYGLQLTPDYYGAPLLEHGGALKGCSAHLVLAPGEGLSAVALGNLEGGYATRARAEDASEASAGGAKEGEGDGDEGEEDACADEESVEEGAARAGCAEGSRDGGERGDADGEDACLAEACCPAPRGRSGRGRVFYVGHGNFRAGLETIGRALASQRQAEKEQRSFASATGPSRRSRCSAHRSALPRRARRSGPVSCATEHCSDPP